MRRESGSGTARRGAAGGVRKVHSGMRQRRLRQQGVALAIVVWFIAGMSLLVAGMVSHVRVDTQLAQLHVARAKATSAGDGAIRLMLAERALRGDSAAGATAVSRGVYQLGGSTVSVSLYPAAGLIDLNTAPQPVLAALFLIVGQVSEGEANFLADNVVKWRRGAVGPDKSKARVHEFQAIEDLLRIDGMSRALLDAVRDFVVAGKGSGSATDWALAPEALMPVLEKANPGELQQAYSRREKLAGSAASSSAGGGLQGEDQSLSGVYRVDAVVQYGDQRWLRRRWIAMGSAPGSLLPWRVVRTEPPRVY
jgi:general secretion pathway protein K